jgi:hypothetical protein
VSQSQFAPGLGATAHGNPLANLARGEPRRNRHFDTGTTLQLTGQAHFLWDRRDFAELNGAERAVEIQIGEIVETEGPGPLGWRFREYSPFNPR